eukprot:m.37555 g.37555  ORF g.37555 m.37555 type:complete len:533 (-) comp6743_c0_seq3:669-2267(-)
MEKTEHPGKRRHETKIKEKMGLIRSYAKLMDNGAERLKTKNGMDKFVNLLLRCHLVLEKIFVIKCVGKLLASDISLGKSVLNHKNNASLSLPSWLQKWFYQDVKDGRLVQQEILQLSKDYPIFFNAVINKDIIETIEALSGTWLDGGNKDMHHLVIVGREVLAFWKKRKGVQSKEDKASTESDHNDYKVISKSLPSTSASSSLQSRRAPKIMSKSPQSTTITTPLSQLKKSGQELLVKVPHKTSSSQLLPSHSKALPPTKKPKLIDDESETQLIIPVSYKRHRKANIMNQHGASPPRIITYKAGSKPILLKSSANMGVPPIGQKKDICVTREISTQPNKKPSQSSSTLSSKLSPQGILKRFSSELLYSSAQAEGRKKVTWKHTPQLKSFEKNGNYIKDRREHWKNILRKEKVWKMLREGSLWRPMKLVNVDVLHTKGSISLERRGTKSTEKWAMDERYSRKEKEKRLLIAKAKSERSPSSTTLSEAPLQTNATSLDLDHDDSISKIVQALDNGVIKVGDHHIISKSGAVHRQ